MPDNRRPKPLGDSLTSMGRKRQDVCAKWRCHKPPFLGGLCKEHHQQDQQETQRRHDAADALHRGVVDGSVFQTDALRQELDRLRKWWYTACDAVNYSRPHSVLKDEAEYAVEWCIALAKELVDAERAARLGRLEVHYSLEYTREWVWERFNNLERGLMSNGIARPENRIAFR